LTGNCCLSLKEIQLPLLREYAQEKGFTLSQEFVFSETADQKIRTKFNEMIDYIKKNKDVKSIIAYRVDRMTRNYRDAVLINDLIVENDIEVHFVHDKLVINRNSIGRDICDWDTKVFLAKQFLNRLREDAIYSGNHMLKSGLWPSKAPFGYKNIALEKRKKWIEPDPVKSEIVKAIFQLYGTGSISMASISKRIREEFGFKICKGSIDQILKNKFYMGVMSFGGQEFPHGYEILIPKQLFERVQDVKAGHHKKKVKYAGLPFAYRGLFVCAECGSAITPEIKKGKYIYYHCTESKQGKHGAKWIREEELTKQLSETFRGLKIPQEVLDDMVDTLKQSHEDKQKFHSDLFNNYKSEYEKYQSRIDAMYLDKLDRKISASDYERRLIVYQNKQEELQMRMNNLHEANKEYYLNAKKLLELSSKALDIFESSDFEVKSELVNFTLQNLRLNGSNIEYEWAVPFNTVHKYASRKEWHARQDSNL
jgi:site-specific DNA recombinase